MVNNIINLYDFFTGTFLKLLIYSLIWMPNPPFRWKLKHYKFTNNNPNNCCLKLVKLTEATEKLPQKLTMPLPFQTQTFTIWEAAQYVYFYWAFPGVIQTLRINPCHLITLPLLFGVLFIGKLWFLCCPQNFAK